MRWWWCTAVAGWHVTAEERGHERVVALLQQHLCYERVILYVHVHLGMGHPLQHKQECHPPEGLCERRLHCRLCSPRGGLVPVPLQLQA